MLYGRDRERDRIGELLDAARFSRGGVLVVHGPPGVGKTALLEDARERADDLRVLAVRGVQSESELAFAGLHGLLRPALAHVDALPAPQAAALQGALGLAAEPADRQFLVFAACLTLLSELAERRPLLCLVDDAQWLDAASADAVEFVARRLGADGIALLLGQRDGEGRDFAAAGLPALEVPALDGAAAEAVLTQGGRHELPDAVRARLVEQARGNPLALVELPKALTAEQLTGAEALPESLALTRQLESAFLARVRRLPDDAARLLLVVAADDSEELPLVLRAAEELGVGDDALAALERAGLVSVAGARLELVHPLLRSAVLGAATTQRRLAAHGALAAALAGSEAQADRRAWHLASSVLEADETVALELEGTAARALDRSAPLVAARALERAAQLSPDDASTARRFGWAALAASRAGRDADAVALAQQAAPLVPNAAVRADLAQVVGRATVRSRRPIDAVPLFLDGARALAADRPVRAFELLLEATWAATEAGDRAGQREICLLAATIPPAADAGSRFTAAMLAGVAALGQGDVATAVPLLQRATEVGADAPDPRQRLWAGIAAAWRGDSVRAVALMQSGADLARAYGALGVLAPALRAVAQSLLFAQRFDDAALAADEAEVLGRDTHADNLVTLVRSVLAVLAAVRGDDDVARAHAQHARDVGRERGLPLGEAMALWALGLLALARGRPQEALEHLDGVDALRGSIPPFVHAMVMPDRVEAAVRSGDADTAAASLAHLEAWAAGATTPWAASRVALCRALLADGEDATALYERAVELADDTRPFDLARMRLAFGEHLRRQHRRADARVPLRAALEAFDRLRAQPWAERVRVELRATGETAAKRRGARSTDLTPQELQIARLVGEGLSNKEVAAQLFLSPRTVDAHLRNVFAKLEVNSRTQLARRVLQADEERVGGLGARA